MRQRIKALSEHGSYRKFSYRRIWALLRRDKVVINKKTVRLALQDMGLSQPRIWHRPMRPKRVEKMRSQRPDQGWQIAVTNFSLSDFAPLFLVTIIDCCTR